MSGEDLSWNAVCLDGFCVVLSEEGKGGGDEATPRPVWRHLWVPRGPWSQTGGSPPPSDDCEPGKASDFWESD